MTNSNTPQYPEGTGPVAGEPQQQPPFAPQQPYGQPGGYPPQPYPSSDAPAQPSYAPPGQVPQPGYPQAPYAQAYPQQQAPALPPRQARPPRAKVDGNGVPYGVGPFTLREVLFLGATALVFLASFLPFLGGDYADVFGYASAWTPAIWLVVPAALLLVAAAALVVVRRLAPARRLSVGSLSVDQFASAVSVVTAGFYLGALFLILGFPAWFGGGSDILEPGSGVVVGLLFSLLAVVVTTIAPWIPLFRADFLGRPEIDAHPVARPANAVPRRPRTERPAAPQQPAPYPSETGMSLPQAGPGGYAAYQRKGSQPAPSPVDEPVALFLSSTGAVAAVGYQPEQDAAPGVAADAAPDERTVAQPVDSVQDQPAVDDQPTASAPPVDDLTDAEATQALPTENNDQPRTETPVDVARVAGAPKTGDAETVDDETVDPVAAPPIAVDPVLVATDVPAVDPQGVAAIPADQYRNDHDDDADTDLDTESGEPAPVSAFSHVSARAAASSTAAEASDNSGPIAAAPTAVFSTQPFWVYSPVPRPVVDEVSGATVFEIGPSAWALAIIDRGSELVIRHDDGRIGVLRNLEGITRG